VRGKYYVRLTILSIFFSLLLLNSLTSRAQAPPGEIRPAASQEAQTPVSGDIRPPTGANYWNAKSRFVGSRQCAVCHAAQAKSFHESSMSGALAPVESCDLLKGDVHFTVAVDGYSYQIARTKDKVTYRVTDNKGAFEAPLEYAFGQGKAGQTYVYSLNGVFHETRVSYYSEINGLALTVGAINSKPGNLQEAAGRVMDPADTRNCFGCHTTGARVGNEIQLKNYEPGVQCESCHGPGGAHIDSIRNGKPAAGSIRALKGMDPQQSNEFCGVCHRTWETVMTMGLRGINNVRFPPYRLTNSPCFSVEDRRIACTSCHDPHGRLVQDDKSYDAKCTACHNAQNSSIQKRKCPVGKEACTSCHMPKVETAEAHHAFRDHWFRVVRSKDGYPD
jgi:hypothetical protein